MQAEQPPNPPGERSSPQEVNLRQQRILRTLSVEQSLETEHYEIPNSSANNNNSQQFHQNNENSIESSLQQSLVEEDMERPRHVTQTEEEAAASITRPSTLFNRVFSENKVFVLSVIAGNILMSVIAWILYDSKCTGNTETSLEEWNYQWAIFFAAKAVYHFFMYLQLFSNRLKQLACETIGEMRTEIEDQQQQNDFAALSQSQLTQMQKLYEKIFLAFYYQRNCLLKICFFVQQIASLGYVIYGIVTYFGGDYFVRWMGSSGNSSSQLSGCEHYLMIWTYLSIIFVIAFNKQMFFAIIIGVIMIPIFLFGYLPYWVYKYCKNRAKKQNVFKNFKKQKFSSLKTQGETECAICKMEFENSETVTVLPCNQQHYFHTECIMGWLKVHTTCPFCRFDFFKTEADNNLVQTGLSNINSQPPQLPESNQQQPNNPVTSTQFLNETETNLRVQFINESTFESIN